MLWMRIALVLAPLIAVGLGVLAYRDRNEVRLPPRDYLSAIYHGPKLEVDLLRGTDPISLGIRELVLDSLVELDSEGRLVPGLARRWSHGDRLTFIFREVAHAEAAAARLNELKSEFWESWGLVEVAQTDVQIDLEMTRPDPEAGIAIRKTLPEGEEGPLEIHRVRVDLNTEGARERHRHFLDEAIEGGQVRRVDFHDDTAYDLYVAGDIARFMEELWIYYGEGNETLKNIRVVEQVDFLNAPKIVFRLAGDRVWHDGIPVTTGDVIFTIDVLRGLPEGTPLGQLARIIDQVDATSEGDVIISLKEPLSSAIAIFSQVKILPAHFLREPSPQNWPPEVGSLLPGTGSVRLSVERLGSFNLEVTGGNGYFPGGYQRMKFSQAGGRLERVASRKMGQIDALFLPNASEVYHLASEPGAELVEFPSGSWVFLGFNQERSILGNQYVRSALARAIDIRGMISEALGGRATEIESIFAPESGVRSPMQAHQYDPGTSQRILAEQGWKPGTDGVLEKDGRRFSFELLTSDEDPLQSEVARYLQKAWAEIGVEVDVLDLPPQDLVSKAVVGRDFDAIIAGWKADRIWDQRHLWHSASVPPAGSNFLGLANPEIDRLLDALQLEYNAGQRKALAKNLQEKVMAEKSLILLYEPVRSVIHIEHNAEAAQSHSKDPTVYPVHKMPWEVFFDPAGRGVMAGEEEGP